MTEQQEDQELVLVAAHAAEIRAGLDARYTSEQLQRPLSRRMVHALVAATTAATALKLKALSARISELEAGGVRYAGIWQRALPYRKGSVVTSDGAMWIALADTPEGVVPGSDPSIWQLAAKSARPKASGR